MGLCMKTLRSIVTAFAVCLTLGGCLNGSGNQTFADGFYRFVHVSPGADTVSISVNGANTVPTLSYHAATSYNQLAWGTPTIVVKSTVAGGPTYVSTNIPVAGEGHYTYFLYGGGASTVGLSLRDDVSDAGSGQFLLRSVNLATGIAPVDIYLLAQGASLATSTPIFTASSYGANNLFTQFAIGDYNLVVTPTGTKTVIYDSGKQGFTQNTKATLLLYATGSGALVNGALLYNGTTGPTTFVDNPAARFRFLAATFDVPVIDLLIDAAVAVGNASYGGLSAYASLAAGNRNFKIQPTPTPGAYIFDQNGAISGGFDYSLAAYSVPGTGAAGLMALQDNNLPPPTGKVTLRIVNAGSDTTAYDLYANTTKLVSGIPQAAATTYQVLDAGDYTLAFNLAGTTTVAASATATLAAGHVYTIYAYGRLGASQAALATDN
jgi:hypothetical protein